MGEVYKQKISLKIIIYAFLLSCIIMIVTTPVHEAAHWVMSDLDSYIQPIEFHLFDDKSFQNKNNVLSSALGYIVVKERYPGAFEDRPLWFDLIQEIICISIQILLTLIIVTKLLGLLVDKNLITIKTA